jgi:sensor domain CHASE-containing protein/two-component sensor histidine kinase
MSLYAKVVMLLCGLFAAYGAVDYAVQRKVILPSFERLETDLARTDMERVTRAIDGELGQLQTFCADWGNWLETYKYMAGENATFIQDNMTPSTIVAAGLDVVAFVDKDGRFVWRQGLQPGTDKELDYQFLSAEALDPAHPFMDAIRKGEAAKGIVQTEHGPAMIVTAPVLDGAGNGPHHGAVLLARVITPEVAARLAEQAQVKLEVLEAPPASIDGAGGRPLTTARVVQGKFSNAVFRNLEDIYGRPSLMLRIDVPRDVSARGRDAIGYALLSVFVAGVIVMLALLTALRRMVLRPVSRLTRHAVKIAEGDDLTTRMNVTRADEIGILAREFDRMVDKLADARRRLVDQSFEAGAAQVTSGVLHNVGNAMTPLRVTVSSLQESLRAAPLGEIEMVLAELEAGVADPKRQDDLEQFLRLAARELVRVASMAGNDTEALARQAEAIQSAMAQQLRESRAGPVVETIDLATLLDRSIELVPPALRGPLVIEFDDSIRAAGALPLPRITLQQVFQNLVQNAAEAALLSGQERCRLRISCELVPVAEGTELLSLLFADEGVGIPEQDLTRIFENGYSTKSRATNHGIGLHWCANALQALGGSIRAEYRPRGGATLKVTIPLRRTGAGATAQAA